ncbi:ROK family protein [Brachybacterium sp. GCM10030268]|uniref:ROK family protein n=1 Tax=Brachybacterium sp. GCM10030268 TaxID=3273382 RepID=UPI00361D5995
MTERGADREAGSLAVDDLGSDSVRAVYRDLLRFGPRSRSELTSRLGLSAPTVTRATRELLDAHRLRSLESVVRPKGRPHQPLDIEENLGPRFIGVKVTADEIHAMVTTVRGNALETLVLPLADTSPETVLTSIATPVAALAEAHPRLTVVGVSLGGRVADRRTVLSSTLLDWSEPVELAAALEARLDLPVVVENDLLAMVHGLHWFGIGRAYRSFAVLTIGAGVAIGTVLDGRVVEGHTRLAGLTERLPVGLDRDGALLTVGRAARTDQVLARAREAGILTAEQGVDDLRRRVADGDRDALDLVRGLARALASTAATITALVDPEAIVLGGETLDLVRAADPLFEDVLRTDLAPAQRDIVVRDLSGDFDEWARGAAVIAIQEFVGPDA